jgi:peptidyl-tRNA hydrolase, PTH1 family
MYSIIGLGNPGEKYEKTRHNAGFMVLDEFAKKHNFPPFEFDKMVNSLASKGSLSGEQTILAKPQTMMNNSGSAIKKLLDIHPSTSLGTSNLIIVHDDIDLPLGTMRVSRDSGSAGHRGVESIIQHIGTKDFTRIRIGILPDRGKPQDVEAFVLKPFEKKELPVFSDAMEKAVDALDSISITH